MTSDSGLPESDGARGADGFLQLLDEVQTIARSGLNYPVGPFDRERYERLLQVAINGYAVALGLPHPQVRTRLSAELGHLTPKVGADAAIFDDDGRILLMRRADDGTWSLPGGWVEPNEAPSQAAERETLEETGLEVQVRKLVDVFFRPAGIGYGPHSAVAIVYLCDTAGGTLRGSHESTELAYHRIDEVPAWHELHERYARAASQALHAA